MKQLGLGFLIGVITCALFFLIGRKSDSPAPAETVSATTETKVSSKSNRIESSSSPEKSRVKSPSEVKDILTFTDNFQLTASVQNMSLDEIEDYLNSPDFSETYFHGRLKTDFLESLFTRYANLDPNGAVDFLKESKNPARGSAAFPLFYQWSLNDPSSAQLSLNALKDTPLYSNAVNGAVAGASRIDPQWGLDISEEHVDGRYDGVALWHLAEDKPAEALEHPSMQNKNTRYTKGRILSRWLMESPAEATAWLTTSPENVSSRTVDHLVRVFKDHDPELAAQLEEIVSQNPE